MTEPAGDGPGAGEPGGPEPSGSSRSGRILLALLGLYALLVLLAAFAQLTDNRALLDLFDLRRWFTN